MKATLIGRSGIWERLEVPLYLERVSAGFPSPAQDYVEQALDLNELCIKRPAATFFVRVQGDSMIEAGMYTGDILVVDRSIQPGHGDVVIACLDGEFAVKELATRPSPRLLSRNRHYPPLLIDADQELEIFGVVTNLVREMRKGQ